MADAGVTGVVAKLGELAAAEATALLRVDAEIRVLRRKLAYLQALVRGADRQRRGRARPLLLWLRETREVAFERSRTPSTSSTSASRPSTSAAAGPAGGAGAGTATPSASSRASSHR